MDPRLRIAGRTDLPKRDRASISLGISAVIWALAMTAGVVILADYHSRPGEAAAPPLQWPPEISLERDPFVPTMLVFLHPHCPCSRASLSELVRLVEQHRKNVVFHVLFIQPPECSLEWSRTNLWEEATARSDLQVTIDEGAGLARKFQVRTSGQALLYDSRGTLQFNGGITPGRGHQGDSTGRSIVNSIVAGDSRGNPQTCAAFGCPLLATPARDTTFPIR